MLPRKKIDLQEYFETRTCSKPSSSLSLFDQGSLLLRGNADDFCGSDLILFKSIGVAIQDLFISSLALESVPFPVTVKL